MMKSLYCFHDEAPRIGSGWRAVEIVSLGHKWVKIRYQTTCVRLKRAVWDDIATSKRDV